MLPAKIMLAFHFMWFDWHDMVTKVRDPLASGITNVPPSRLFQHSSKPALWRLHVSSRVPSEILSLHGVSWRRESRGRRSLDPERGRDRREDPSRETVGK